MKLIYQLTFMLLLAAVSFAGLSECLADCQASYDATMANAQALAASGGFTENLEYGGSCPRNSVYGGSGPYANLAKCVAVQQMCIADGGSDCNAAIQSCCVEETQIGAEMALGNCKYDCEYRYPNEEPSAPSQPTYDPEPEEPEEEVPALPPCKEAMGTINNIEGSPTVTRGGVTVALSPGDTYCLDDVITTSGSGRLFINFNDGNIRFVGQNSVMKISNYNPGSQDIVTRLAGVSEHIIYDKASQLNYDTICGGDARTTSSGAPDVVCKDSVIYTPHSTVLYQFTPYADDVIVLEGYVEAIDTSSGEYITINSGEEYVRDSGNPITSGALYEVDTESVSTTSSSSSAEGCCGPALILLVGACFTYYVRE